MSIKKEYVMIIDKGSSKLNENLEIYTSDVGISVYFNILDSSYIKLSNQRDLFAKVVLKDRLGKTIEGDTVPIVNNIVIFTIGNDIMNRLTETGKYDLYIIVMDDKQNRKILPPVKLSLLNTNITFNDLDASTIGSTINNVAIENYGNELTVFNLDGSYNRTIWLVGDIITTSKMNKIEQAISKLRDGYIDVSNRVDSFSDEKVHQTLFGSEGIPITISNLEKGFYIISGFIQDFVGEAPYEIKGESYYMVTYVDAYKSKISRCLSDEEEFTKYLYDKNQKAIYNDERNIKNVRVEEGYADIKEDKYQYLTTSNPVNVLLPHPNTFADIDLYIMITSSTATVSFPTIKWNNVPQIREGELCKVNLVYLDSLWYGFYERVN